MPSSKKIPPGDFQFRGRADAHRLDPPPPPTLDVPPRRSHRDACAKAGLDLRAGDNGAENQTNRWAGRETLPPGALSFPCFAELDIHMWQGSASSPDSSFRGTTFEFHRPRPAMHCQQLDSCAGRGPMALNGHRLLEGGLTHTLCMRDEIQRDFCIG